MVLDGYGFSIEVWHDIDGAADVEFLVNLDGTRYFGWAFTLAGIEAIMRKDGTTGECLGGAYFRADGLIVVKDISGQALVETVSDLIKENGGTLEGVFPTFHDRAETDDKTAPNRPVGAATLRNSAVVRPNSVVLASRRHWYALAPCRVDVWVMFCHASAAPTRGPRRVPVVLLG